MAWLERAGKVSAPGLEPVFDAEYSCPDLISELEIAVPCIRDVMGSLRENLPVAPHSGIGALGRTGFFRLPNHYRSVCLIIPPSEGGDARASPGVIVFKGTEPLIPDFRTYFDWMLEAPFRSSLLPLGLHFPLDMKLPPAAMWIDECIAEQEVTSRLQQKYLGRHGRLARLPLPLFVFKLSQGQNGRYEEVIRGRLPDDAMKKIRRKLMDGLGVEVYYYPELPVRVADVMIGNVREAFKSALDIDRVDDTFESWIALMAEMLCLDFMPYAPWHHGMGGCVDPGNACIDGGFNDLLTLVPFDAIPDEALFRNSLHASIRLLGDSVVGLACAAMGVPTIAESDVGAFTVEYLTSRIRRHMVDCKQRGEVIDLRLWNYFDSRNSKDIFDLIHRHVRSRARSQQFQVIDGYPGVRAGDLTPAFSAAPR